MQIRIAPSILSADFANLESELESINDSDMIHVDVMDGHFVPNLTIGLPVLKRIREVTETELDVHLMIENPEIWVERYAETGIDSLTFHFEATKDPNQVISRIRDGGTRVAMAIKPATSFDEVVDLIPELDMLLIMTVEPGFGGQSFMETAIPKIQVAREYVLKNALSVSIQVDGGITEDNIARVAEAGADTFVAGTSVFKSMNRNQTIKRLRQLASNL